MRLSLEVVRRDGNEVVLRLVAFNDSSKPIEFDRRLLVGPNGVVEGAEPWPVSLEPAAKDSRRNAVLLSPFCFYGRERPFTVNQPTTFHGYLAAKAEGFLPAGPANAEQLVTAAEPLRLEPAR